MGRVLECKECVSCGGRIHGLCWGDGLAAAAAARRQGHKAHSQSRRTCAALVQMYFFWLSVGKPMPMMHVLRVCPKGKL